MIKSKIALIVIDAQNDFYSIDHIAGDKQVIAKERRDKIIHHSLKTIKWADKNKIPVIWTYEMHRKSGIDMGIELILEGKHCIEGTDGDKLIPELAFIVKDQDIHIMNKRRWDAFFATDLDIILRELRTEMVILIGSMASACVLATAFGAKMRDYHITMIEDAIWGSESMKTAMKSIAEDFCNIISSKNLDNLKPANLIENWIK